MESRILKPVLAVYVGLFLLFLYGPFIVLGILSFQQGPEGGPQFPITHWSIFWYRDIFGLTPPSRVAPLPIGTSLFRSLSLAGMTMITSTVLGVMAAQAFRKNFPGKTASFYLIVLGMIVPGTLRIPYISVARLPHWLRLTGRIVLRFHFRRMNLQYFTTAAPPAWPLGVRE